MPKQIVDGSEFFDGQKVSIHQGRFTGKFDLDEIDGVTISTGDQVTFMVTVRASSPKFTNDAKTGALKRENTFKIESASLIDPDQAKFIYDSMSVDVEGVNSGLIEAELDFLSGAPTSPSEASNGVSATDTHETLEDPLESLLGPLDGKLAPKDIYGDLYGPSPLPFDKPKPSFKEVTI